MLDQGLHRGIIAILLAQLYREAFAQIPRADAGRVEFLQHRENAFDILRRCTEAFGGLPGTTGDATAITVRGFGPEFNEQSEIRMVRASH